MTKPGKDPIDCCSYRSIALLNTDLKILTKVLATRLARVILSLVDIDQTGFMPEKSTDTNQRRVITHLQVPHDNQSTRVLVSIDIEKVFEAVDWQYMHKVLELMGFGLHFRR